MPQTTPIICLHPIRCGCRPCREEWEAHCWNMREIERLAAQDAEPATAEFAAWAESPDATWAEYSDTLPAICPEVP